MQEVLLPVFGVIAIIGAAAVSIVFVRFASAYAKRFEGRTTGAVPRDAAIAELREELDAMQERLDFVERALVTQRHPSGRALPAQGERGGGADR